MAWPISSTPTGAVFLSLDFCNAILCILPRALAILALLAKFAVNVAEGSPLCKGFTWTPYRSIALERLVCFIEYMIGILNLSD